MEKGTQNKQIGGCQWGALEAKILRRKFVADGNDSSLLARDVFIVLINEIDDATANANANK